MNEKENSQTDKNETIRIVLPPINRQARFPESLTMVGCPTPSGQKFTSIGRSFTSIGRWLKPGDSTTGH